MAFEKTKGWLAEDLESLKTLLVEQLEDIYSAETQLIEALYDMEADVNDLELKQAFADHLEETKQHKERLDDIFSILGKEPSEKTCKAMRGLIKEAKEMSGHRGIPAVQDAGIIAAAQRIEHYEISVYGTVRTLAERVGEGRIAELLQQTLDEEFAADKRLTRIAQTNLYPDAQSSVRMET